MFAKNVERNARSCYSLLSLTTSLVITAATNERSFALESMNLHL